MTDTYDFAEVTAAPGSVLLVLLHGTGGNESSLLGLGAKLLPGAHVIAPRGDVNEGGALRFFRRTAEGVYDMADLERATSKMADFVSGQRRRLAPPAVYALGYSNGANILASLLFARPDLLDRAVLMHPLIPFTPPPQPRLTGMPILITAGRHDSICPPETTERLSRYFDDQGARAQLVWHDGGHQLRPEELEAAEATLGHAEEIATY